MEMLILSNPNPNFFNSNHNNKKSNSSPSPQPQVSVMSTSKKMGLPLPLPLPLPLNILDSMPKRFLLTLPMSKRTPPLVDRNWLSYRLMNLSRGQLEQQACLKEPDLRRCVGHAHLHRHSSELTHRDLMRLIESFTMEEDDDDEDGELEDAVC